MVINGDVVSRLDMVHIEGVLQDSTTLLLTIRSCSIERSHYFCPDIKPNNINSKLQLGIPDSSRGNQTSQPTHSHYCPHHFYTSSPALPNTTGSYMSSSGPSCSSTGQTNPVEKSLAQGGFSSSAGYASQSNSYIEKMICPPPPSFVPMSDKRITDLIVPEPNLGYYPIFVYIFNIPA